MVEIGKRSYGLYLWTWPVSRICNAYTGSWPRFAAAMLIAVPISEVCYRFIETPIRRGALGRFWAARERTDWRLIIACSLVSALALGGALVAFYRSSQPAFDAAVDTGNTVVFDPGVAAGATSTLPTSSTPSSTPTTPTGSAGSTSSVVSVVSPTDLPRRLVIVGDSMAHSLMVNLPKGINSTFLAADGSVEGCSVYDSGRAVSTRPYSRSFNSCVGWDTKWGTAAKSSSAQLALVVLGAWDVFDVTSGSNTLAFASTGNDQRFTTGLQKGIDALTANGAKVALLEVACMRPKDVKGAGVPALPERGDDQRVGHLNDLLKRVAAKNKATTTFVTGPPEYCNDPTIATNLAYRWDGVHPFKPGAKLTMEAITQQLLSIPIG